MKLLYFAGGPWIPAVFEMDFFLLIEIKSKQNILYDTYDSYHYYYLQYAN